MFRVQKRNSASPRSSGIGAGLGVSRGLDAPRMSCRCASEALIGHQRRWIPNFQYSSGNKNVVARRSASVMTQNFVPLLIV
jgi:hypothetical protein